MTRPGARLRAVPDAARPGVRLARVAARCGVRGPLVLLAAALLTLVTLLGAGCGAASSPSPGALDVVASTSFLRDIAQNVAGSRSRVMLIPDGVDPHEFDPTPAEVTAAGAICSS